MNFIRRGETRKTAESSGCKLWEFEYEEFNLEGSYLERERERKNTVTKLVLDMKNLVCLSNVKKYVYLWTKA